jgi:hypothetical protein
VLLHGLYDLETALLVSDSSQEIADLSRTGIQNIFLAYLGLTAMLPVPVWLWLGIQLARRGDPSSPTHDSIAG